VFRGTHAPNSLVVRFGPVTAARIPWDRMRTSPLFRALAVAGIAASSSLGVLVPVAGGSVMQATAAPAWTKTVCTTIGAWEDTLERAATKAATGSTASATVAKKKLTKILGQATAATGVLVARLGKAGAPAVPDGKELATILRDQYRQLAKSLKGARADLQQADAADPVAFGAAARSVEDAFESAFEQSQAAFNAAGVLDAPPLVDAFLAQQACAGLTGP
jgi:hypothetical protein